MGLAGQKRWVVATPAPAALSDRLSALSPLLVQILYNRGIISDDALASFLGGTPATLSPFLMQGMGEAVTLIRRTIADGEPIVVYGDYDVDGVTASAILVQALGALGAKVEPYIPSRADEGYGLNLDAIGALAQDGLRLLVTVDCGTRSLDEVALAARLGLRVIITDHHHVGGALPQADVILNPRQPTCLYPFKDLSGVGVAYKLVQALLRVNHQVPLPSTQMDLDESDLLDLVALGTVADMVPLLGENHALVSAGLARLNAAQRPGLHALMGITGVEPGKITAKTIGYALAPRLNAAGRMKEAATALELLMATDMTEALPLAEELERLNQERRDLTSQVREAARLMVSEDEILPPLIFAASDSFQQGVVGLAASRLLEEFYRPAVVVAIEGEFSKGSARSIPELHITEALDELSELLVRHGGHAAAAGFTVRTERLPELRARLLQLVSERLTGAVFMPVLRIDAEVSLSALTLQAFQDLERLQPFGYGNAEPVFVSRRVRVRNARVVGAEGRHLKLTLVDEIGHPWDGIAFRQGDWFGRLPESIDIAYFLELNSWNGWEKLQLNIQDIHFPGET